MAEPNKFIIVVPDYRLNAYYSANNTWKTIACYTQSDGSDAGNTQFKLGFANACTNAGWTPRTNVHAVQYIDGEGEIEYANGSPHSTFTGNTTIGEFVSLLDQYWKADRVDRAEAERIAAIPSWDEIRGMRDAYLGQSDGIYSYATEKGQTVPTEWVTYRQDLRDIPTTYGSPTGNTELVVFPDKPSWPEW